MNALSNLADVLEHGRNAITLDPELGRRAKTPIDRMLAFADERKQRVRASGDMACDATLYANVGPA